MGNKALCKFLRNCGESSSPIDALQKSPSVPPTISVKIPKGPYMVDDNPLFSTPPATPQIDRKPHLTIQIPSNIKSPTKTPDLANRPSDQMPYIPPAAPEIHQPPAQEHGECNEIVSPIFANASPFFSAPDPNPKSSSGSRKTPKKQNSWRHYPDSESDDDSDDPRSKSAGRKPPKVRKPQKSATRSRDSSHYDSSDTPTTKETRGKPVLPTSIINADNNYFIGPK